MLVGQDGEENRVLAIMLLGITGWDGMNIAKRLGKVDPALAIVALQQEIKDRGLEAQARERGLL